MKETTGLTGRPAADGAQSLPPGGLLPVDAIDAIAAHVDGAFVLVVKTTGGRYRRRCFLSAASAEKAACNATEAGHSAQVYLAQLKPLWKLSASSPNLFTADGDPR
jgi:hypothetical protein